MVIERVQRSALRNLLGSRAAAEWDIDKNETKPRGMASIKLVGVVGAGQMGSGIAQVAASANMQVIIADVSTAALERGMRAISSSLSKFVKKQTLSQVISLNLHNMVLLIFSASS